MERQTNESGFEADKVAAPRVTVADYWVKVLGMLQHNWAAIEPRATGCVVFFFTDHSDVFDTLEFASVSCAIGALSHNGFRRFDDEYAEWIRAPDLPLRIRHLHKGAGVYSSGEYWRPDSKVAHFLSAQQDVFPTVLEELKSGRKLSHWMWFVFPQVAGLGRSSNAHRYAIKSLSQALEFANDPVLGARLRECSQLLLALEGTTARDVMGHPDDLKLQSSMTLFSEITNYKPYSEVLNKFYGGQRDLKTLSIIKQWHRRTDTKASPPLENFPWDLPED